MRARISITANAILCERENAEPVPIPINRETLVKLKDWTRRYRRAVRTNDPLALGDVGGAIFDFLDGTGWATQWLRGAYQRVLEIAVRSPDTEAELAFLDLPWEILAAQGAYLASDAIQPFVVFRSIGRPVDATPIQPAHCDLAMMFMAASPEGQHELGFEAEEAAILRATERLDVHLSVEESGCAEFLRDRLALDGPFEVVHVSCHGNIDKTLGPILALESPEGDVAFVTPEDFSGVLGESRAPLVFLSACRTAEGAGAEPFARELVRAGVANVLGWDGSVNDSDATHFAQIFYTELARYQSVQYAAAMARGKVLQAHLENPEKGRHWHLARLYAGPHGGGSCCDSTKHKRVLRKNAGYREFLDKANSRVPVATAQQFVGRRRQAQKILRAFRDGGKGVLIFGMGNIGKSTLAARIANRMPRHQTIAVYDRYDALAVFDKLVAAMPGSERQAWRQNWHDQIAGNGSALGDALEDMLRGPFNQTPVLLIVDDLHEILEKPRRGQTITPVADAPSRPRDAWRISLGSVLRAFNVSDTASRLLLTSRYDFTLPDGQGGDLSKALERVQLRPMKDEERVKQLRAAKALAELPGAEQGPSESDMAVRALELAGGNPGLQEILCRPILAGELEAAHKALVAVARWKDSGKSPKDESAAQEFFQRVTFETYRDALTRHQRRQLRAATLFSEGLPVPVPALKAVGEAAGVDDPLACLNRLIGLGLVDSWGEIFGVEHAAANPLARPLAGGNLTDREQKRLAAAAVEPLAKTWRDADGDFPRSPLAVETANLALIGGAPAEILDASADAAGSFLFRVRNDAATALDILRRALDKIERQGGSPRPGFFLIGANCAERIGETGLRIELLKKGRALESDDKVTRAQISATYAVAMIAETGPDEALKALRDAVALFESAGDMYSRAVTMGQIGDILEPRGELDEALRIRREEELPVYERLGDVRSRAVTMGKIADILQFRGELDEALRIHLEERLPIALKVGDTGSVAHIRFSCARIRLARGGMEKGEAQVIGEELVESFALYKKLQRPDGIGWVGLLFGQFLATTGKTAEALTVLEEAAAAFDKLNWAERAAQVRELQKQVREESKGESGSSSGNPQV